MKRISRERLVAVLVGLLHLGASSAAWALFGPVAVLPAIALALVVLLLAAFYVMNRVRHDVRDGVVQVQSLLELRAALPGDVALPTFGAPSIEPDCANVIARHILERRPRLIVEAGSGSSTLLAAACLRQIGAGKVVALEHMAPFAESVRKNLARRGLEAFGDVRHAPLEAQPCDGRQWPWFAAGARRFDRPIDLVIVDGPQAGRPGRQARFPALPLLAEQLADEAWVIVDDAKREGERMNLARWKALFERWDWEHDVLPTKRGTALIRLRRRA